VEEFSETKFRRKTLSVHKSACILDSHQRFDLGGCVKGLGASPILGFVKMAKDLERSLRLYVVIDYWWERDFYNC